MCEEGNATGVAIATADRTVIGLIAKLVSTTAAEDTPIAKEIAHFIKVSFEVSTLETSMSTRNSRCGAS